MKYNICEALLICVFVFNTPCRVVGSTINNERDLFLNSRFCKTYYEEGVKLYKNKQYSEAKDSFMRVLLFQPKNKSAKRYLKLIKNKQVDAELKQMKSVNTKKEKVKKMPDIKIESLYRQALKFQGRKYYLKASDKYREVISRDPSYKNAHRNQREIEKNMQTIAIEENTPELDRLSYAKGYMFYFSGKYRQCANEWEKALCMNPNNKELKEYEGIAKKIILNEDLEKELKNLFESGVAKYQKKDYIKAITDWETIVEKSKKETYENSLEWIHRAEQQIDLALLELKKVAAEKKAKSADRDINVENRPETKYIDTKTADKCYNEGLVNYAQGKISDAIRLWEMALRYDPEHEKAKRAKTTAENELGNKQKETGIIQ
ncbi:MAG: hypothetical protein A2252_09460 [Elusimicrobia bacterium RIFOXYA2_FULL_39_19]|nr:MAG: hypothetical protein A2252_09460 [Elusimicrobia bacterium RIFOXYA2_FULL_39_19]